MNALAHLLLGASTLLMRFNESGRVVWNSNKVLIFYRSIHPEVFYKKGVLGNFANFTGKHLCEFCEISKNTFFYRTPSMPASGFRIFLYLSFCFTV